MEVIVIGINWKAFGVVKLFLNYKILNGIKIGDPGCNKDF